jgi:hypothetical protein
MRIDRFSKKARAATAVLLLMLVVWIIYSVSESMISADTAGNTGKTVSTYYTAEKVSVARANIAKYRWAQTERDKAVTNAEVYLKPGLDFLWGLITPQNIGRSYAVNQDKGSPVTGKKIDAYGAYPYQIDPVKDPWKITDPSSGY